MSRPGLKDETPTSRLTLPESGGLSLVGQILENRYEVEELIGEGAMGYVYRGRQLRLKRPVAIKVLRPDLAHNVEYMARFEREALTMARCVHENIVSIYDVYVAKKPGEVSYIVMEMVSGSDLDRFLRTEERHLTVRAVLKIIRHLAQGIDAAHAAGVIHRDLKPANMIVTLPQRVAKIMDFGIAKGEQENIFRTQSGMAMGTPAFMSPEQIKGLKVGPPSDIYSFAVSVYRIFARALPFDSNNTSSLLVDHLNKKPLGLRKRNASWPPALEEALDRALAKNPKDRPPSASRLVSEFEEALKGYYDYPFSSFFAPIHRFPLTFWLGRIFRKKFVLAGIAVILLFGALGIGWRFLKRDSGDQVVTAAAPGEAPLPGAGLPVKPTPEATPSIPEDTPISPKPESTLAPSEKTPEAAPVPPEQATPAATGPEVTSPPPAPEPTAAVLVALKPTPTPEPPRPFFSEPYSWGPEITGTEKILELKFIDNLFVENIRRPIFRGQWERARQAFRSIDPEKRKKFFDLLDRYRETYEDLTVTYVRLSEKIDERRAEIQFRTGITGKPRYSEGPARQETLVEAFEGKALLEKREGNWILIDWPDFI